MPPWPDRLTPEEREVCERSLSMHLFHGFAARSHPLTVRALCESLQPGQAVYDPFVGSGTTLIEAALRGAQGLGTDLGGLQVRLARFRATPVPTPMRASLLRRAQQVAEASAERVRRRVRPVRTAPWDGPRHYEPHIYLELCGLREEIAAVCAEDPPLGEALLLIFSSMIIKFSRQRAESSERQVARALGRGQPSRFLLDRARELDRLLAAFAERVPAGTGRPLVWQRDARLGLPPEVPSGLLVDLVLTSPPYLGVYDYAAHQARRCAWLGVAQEEGAEIGARRHVAGSPADAAARYAQDTVAWVGQAARALAPGGAILVLVGDGVIGRTIFPGDAPVCAAAERAGLTLLAACTAERPPPAPGLPARREHLLHFVWKDGTRRQSRSS